MAGRILLYGANGYTGRLAARVAREMGVSPVLAGRSAALVKTTADNHQFAWRAFDLTDPGVIDKHLDGIDVVLHMAGPFSATAQPMVEACLRTRTHYLDITGEIAVFEAMARRHAEAMREGVMLLPGVGFDVVPSDCLLAHMKKRLPTATKLVLAISGLSQPSQGTAKTAMESVGMGTPIRRDGRIEILKRAPRAEFDFGAGPVPCIGVGWGDVSTGFHTTGVPNIQVFFESTPLLERFSKLGPIGTWILRRPFVQRLLKRHIERTISGPSREERANGKARLLAIASDTAGLEVATRLETPEAYLLSARVAMDIAARVADGAAQPGFQTPAKFLGPDYILQVEGTRREDL